MNFLHEYYSYEVNYGKFILQTFPGLILEMWLRFKYEVSVTNLVRVILTEKIHTGKVLIHICD